MPRPSKPKIIGKKPQYTHFTGENNHLKVVLSVEEYETIRLIDYLDYSQDECAKQMQISRSSVVSLYNNARKKIARFLLEGCALNIEGGHYKIEENKGEKIMKVAVTCVEGQVFQHFGHCPSFLVCTIEEGKIVSTSMLNTLGTGCGALAGFLKNHHIDVVICGGIGAGAKNHITAAGMTILPGASGDALAQVESYIAGTLNYDPNTECDHHHEDGHDCHNDHKCH